MMRGSRTVMLVMTLLLSAVLVTSQALNSTDSLPSTTTTMSLAEIASTTTGMSMTTLPSPTTAPSPTSTSLIVLPTATLNTTTTDANVTSPYGDTLRLFDLGALSSCVRSSEFLHVSSCGAPKLAASFSQHYLLLSTLPLVQNTTNTAEKLVTAGLPSLFSLVFPLTVLVFVVVQLISLLLRLPHLVLAVAGEASSLRASVESVLSEGREAQLCRVLALSNTLSILAALGLFGVGVVWRTKVSTAVKVFNASNAPLLVSGQRYAVQASVGTTFGVWYLIAALALLAGWMEKRRVRQQTAVAIAKEELLSQAARQEVAAKAAQPVEEIRPPAPAYSPPEKVEFGDETMSWRLVGDKSGHIYN